jgi:hypothetical protein
MSPVNEIAQDIGRAYDGGTWTGTGITSALANEFGVGYIEVAGASIVIRLARFGDANLSGTVDLEDFNALASNFGDSGKFWFTADFNYDGVVDLDDFNLLASNFGLGAGPNGDVDPEDWAALAAATVPEPAAISVPLAGLSLIRNRRRR